MLKKISPVMSHLSLILGMFSLTSINVGSKDTALCGSKIKAEIKIFK